MTSSTALSLYFLKRKIIRETKGLLRKQIKGLHLARVVKQKQIDYLQILIRIHNSELPSCYVVICCPIVIHFPSAKFLMLYVCSTKPLCFTGQQRAL